jgi:hypothetical protein
VACVWRSSECGLACVGSLAWGVMMGERQAASKGRAVGVHAWAGGIFVVSVAVGPLGGFSFEHSFYVSASELLWWA